MGVPSVMGGRRPASKAKLWRGLAALSVGALVLAGCGTATSSAPLLPPSTPVASATLQIPESSVGVVLVASPTGSVTATSGPTVTGTPPTATNTAAATASATVTPSSGPTATATPPTATNTAAATASATVTPSSGPTATATRTPGPGTPSATRPPTLTPSKTPGPSDDKGFAPSEMPSSQVPPAGVSTIVLASLTTPIKKGADASLTIQTVPNVSCFLTYVEPNGVVSTAEGLGKKIADGTGFCRWDWKISSATSAGTGRLSVAAKGPAVSFDIVITP